MTDWQFGMQVQKLVVYSVGKGEQVKFWDGLLGQDWIGSSLLRPSSRVAHQCM